MTSNGYYKIIIKKKKKLMDITIHDFACKYQPKSVPPI